jgi:GNAT superfamily N-acetyltransferase
MTADVAVSEEVSLQLDTAFDGERISITAWDEDGNGIGFADCEADRPERPRPAEVEVTPDHRRHGVGTALLRALVAAAADRGIRALVWELPADDVAGLRLARGIGAPVARRVVDGRAQTVIFVPADRGAA